MSETDERRETTLGAIMSFSNGKTSPQRSDDAPHPVYGANGVIGKSDEVNSPPNTIVIGRVGSYCGSLQFSNKDCWVTDNAIKGSATTGNDARFLFYLLSTLKLNEWRIGSGQPLLNQAILSSIPATIPPLPEQRRIAGILGALDDKIALNRRMSATLEGMAQALFKAWFVDFEPVRAKMSGRWRRGESLAGMPAELWDAFPARLVATALGDAPAGWDVRALDEIAQFRNGLALQKYRPKDGEESLPVVKIAQLRSGRADSGESATRDITPECVIDNGDVIFAWSASLMVKVWCGGKAALNQHLFKVTSTEYPRWFYLHWLEAHLSEFRRIAADKTTTMGHIKRQHLSEAKCVTPSRLLLDAADGILGDLYTQRVALEIQSSKLAALRDTLLPRLVSGELRV